MFSCESASALAISSAKAVTWPMGTCGSAAPWQTSTVAVTVPGLAARAVSLSPSVDADHAGEVDAGTGQGEGGQAAEAEPDGGHGRAGLWARGQRGEASLGSADQQVRSSRKDLIVAMVRSRSPATPLPYLWQASTV
jgi:hypothetical protein